MKYHSKSHILKTFSAAALFLLGFAAGCGKPEAGGGEMVMSVVAAPVRQQALEETIEAVGTLMADESVEIKGEADGTITAIHFQEGQQVKAGQLLVELDQSKLRASLEEAQANLKMAESTRQRYASLIQSRAVSQQEADQSEAAWAANKALAERLEAELKDATLEAPFDGIAGARMMSVGQYIPRGTAVTTVVDLDPMKLEFRIPERYMGQVRLKQPVKLETDAYPGAGITGEVYFINPIVDTDSRTVLLKAAVPNPDGRLRHGMFARAELIIEIKEKSVVIPETALLHQGDLTFVYAIDGEQKAQMRPVKVGLRLPGAVEIVEGLKAGEQVVAEGHQKLFPGVKVNSRQPDPAPAGTNPA